MEIQIIVDSCCDTTPALRRAMRFVIAPLTVSAGDASFCDDGHIEISQLLAAMKATNQPAASACPSPESYAALMRAAEASVVVTLSSKLSGSYNAACVARDMVLEEYPEKKIHVLDSQSASAGELRQALLLRQLIDGGLSFEDVVEKALARGNYTIKDFKLPIFHFLQRFCGVNPYMDLTDVRPTVADAALSEVFQVPVGSPLLNMEEVDFDIDGKPVFCSSEYFADGIFRHTVMRKKL